MIGSLFYAIRCVLWFPFAVTSSGVTFILLNVYVYFTAPGISMGVFWVSLLICAVTMPMERSLRPPPRHKALTRPTERAILPQLAAMLLRDRGQAPGPAQVRRALPKELRALLAAPVTTPPEAVTHDRAVMQQHAAQGGRRAA